MTSKEAVLGAKVKNLLGDPVIPKGTEGVITEDNGGWIAVTWNPNVRRYWYDKEVDLAKLEKLP
jgi:hypothetical protein